MRVNIFINHIYNSLLDISINYTFCSTINNFATFFEKRIQEVSFFIKFVVQKLYQIILDNKKY